MEIGNVGKPEAAIHHLAYVSAGLWKNRAQF
jgi:hypothetical protein